VFCTTGTQKEYEHRFEELQACLLVLSSSTSPAGEPAAMQLKPKERWQEMMAEPCQRLQVFHLPFWLGASRALQMQMITQISFSASASLRSRCLLMLDQN